MRDPVSTEPPFIYQPLNLFDSHRHCDARRDIREFHPKTGKVVLFGGRALSQQVRSGGSKLVVKKPFFRTNKVPLKHSAAIVPENIRGSVMMGTTIAALLFVSLAVFFAHAYDALQKD
jgi:hypothetical protein